MEIEVNRPKQYQDKIRDYHLWADGKKIGVIKPNSTTKFTLPENTEKIKATIDWCSSQEFEIKSVNSNKIKIYNTFGGNLSSALLLPLYYITFGRKEYLTIESSD